MYNHFEVNIFNNTSILTLPAGTDCVRRMSTSCDIASIGSDLLGRSSAAAAVAGDVVNGCASSSTAAQKWSAFSDRASGFCRFLTHQDIMITTLRYGSCTFTILTHVRCNIPVYLKILFYLEAHAPLSAVTFAAAADRSDG